MLIWAVVAAPWPVETQVPPSVASLGGRVIVFDVTIASPVRRARVTLTSSSGVALVTDSDAEGRYRFNGLSPGLYDLDVVKAGFYVAANALNGVAAARPRVQIDADSAVIRDTVMERGAAIEGRVVDANGAPAKNVVIQVRPFGRAGARLTAAVRSDDRGRYRVHTLPPGDYVVEAAPLSRLAPAAAPRSAASGFSTYFPGVTRIEDAGPVSVLARRATLGVDFTFLTPDPSPSPLADAARRAAASPSALGTSRVVGHITSADNARPVTGAIINVFPWEPPFNVARGSAFTDAQGRFEVTGLPAGSYQLRVSAEGFVDRSYEWTTGAPMGRRIELVEGRSFDQADVAMPRPGAVEGRVLDEFGDPAPGISIQLGRCQ